MVPSRNTKSEGSSEETLQSLKASRQDPTGPLPQKKQTNSIHIW